MSMHDEAQGPEGYDVDRVEEWIREHVVELTPPLAWHRLEGGHSNLTYLITDTAGRQAVILRPPQGELLPKAHDMGREWSLISALGPTAVPVASAIAYVARQLRTWYRSWTSSATAASYDDPRVHALHERLTAELPEQGPARVVHGDYGLHNTLVGAGSEVVAVVDWEISTLGDPLADLGYALNQWAEPHDDLPVRDEAATALPGFHTREALSERYAEKTGRDLSNLSYYIGFNWWKSACIVHGVYARYCEGKKSTEGIDMESLHERIGRYLTLSQRAFSA